MAKIKHHKLGIKVSIEKYCIFWQFFMFKINFFRSLKIYIWNSQWNLLFFQLIALKFHCRFCRHQLPSANGNVLICRQTAIAVCRDQYTLNLAFPYFSVPNKPNLSLQADLHYYCSVWGKKPQKYITIYQAWQDIRFRIQ